jgi:glycosyltransferase involved in cell wall biosynthesis
MRILYVVTGAEFGGAPIHVLQLMEAEIEKGHSVGLVSAPESRLMSEAERIGTHLSPNPYFVHPVQLHNDIRALWSVFRAIRRFQPDLVSAHSTKAGYAARLVCAILRKPVVFTVHGWPFTEGRGIRTRRLLALAERLAGEVTGKIICVSEYDRDLALKFKIGRPDQIVTVYNGVDPKPFLNADGAEVRQEFNLAECLVFTMVGRLVPQKDPLTLLKACQILKGQFKLLVIGDGELRGLMEQFISDNGLDYSVFLAGERKDVSEILAASDIFVLPSRFEGLPYSIIEAMMAGLPIVATRVGGVQELVEEGTMGFLVPPEAPEALAAAIQKLLDGEDLRHKMGQAGREKALREFTLDRMLAKTQKVYKEVLVEKVRNLGSRCGPFSSLPRGKKSGLYTKGDKSI